MSLNVGVWSYLVASAAYFLFSLLLLVSWRGRFQGGLLVAASVVTGLWGAAFAYHAFLGYPSLWWLPILDVARYALWLFFLVGLLNVGASSEGGQRLLSFVKLRAIVVAISSVCLGFLVVHFLSMFGVITADIELYSIFYIGLSVIGLMLLEQLFRNTHPEYRWKIKFLCIGIGGMFMYDLFLYSDALLIKRIDQDFWGARGVVSALVVPFIAISAARNKHWSVDIFVSRNVVFHTATLVWVGLYLVAISGGGYYVRTYGGNWGIVAQAAVLFGAAVLLVVLLFSGNIQARLKVFVNKNFYRHKYDYRKEWLDLIGALSSADFGEGLDKRVLQALAEMVDSKAGILFLKSSRSSYETVAWWKTEVQSVVVEENDPLLIFMREREWLVDLDEYRSSPEMYGKLHLPQWLACFPTAWVIVPLIQKGGLDGFVVLTRSLAPRALNWEDHDLLKTAARQAASYLALDRASAELANARQFEAFNRLSAFVVHDLKNVVGQLSLIVSNSKKYKHNQEFVDDAFSTVENAVGKMQRMLAQLRQGRASLKASKAVKLLPVIQHVVELRAPYLPSPKLIAWDDDICVVADKDRLASVIEHVVHNAQDATPETGKIEISLKKVGAEAIIMIADSGCGMAADFIRNRLFKPFDTTKGNAGMGIGAYECMEFINSLGGSVEVESELGKGTTFRLAIPLLDDNYNNSIEMEGDGLG